MTTPDSTATDTGTGTRTDIRAGSHAGTDVPDARTVGRTVTIADGRAVHYTEYGTGEPVVLLHGGGPGASGESNFSRNIDALAQRFRVIVPDMPGYGRSSKRLDHADPFGSLAGGVRGLLDTLEIPSVHLVGNSYGGACALRLALDTPHRAASLTLMGPGGIGTTRKPPTAGLGKLLAYYGGDGPSRDKLAEFIRGYLVDDPSAIDDAMIDARYAASLAPEVIVDPPLRRPAGPLALRTVWRMDLTRDRRLRSLTVPTLVVWGRGDRVNRPEGARLLAERMPRADVVLFARTGHWVQWERADRFNSLVASFVESHPTSERSRR